MQSQEIYCQHLYLKGLNGRVGEILYVANYSQIKSETIGIIALTLYKTVSSVCFKSYTIYMIYGKYVSF